MAFFARATFSGLRYGQLCQNVVHFEWLGISWDPVAIANHLAANWLPKVVWFSGTGFRYSAVLVQDATNPNLQTATLSVDLAGNVFDDNRCPPFVACVLKIQTLQGGRSGRGRIFLPGVAHDSMQNGLFQANFQQTRQPRIDELKVLYGLSGTSQLRLGLFNRTTNAFNGMSNLTLRPVPGVQRRRNIGIGV